MPVIPAEDTTSPESSSKTSSNVAGSSTISKTISRGDKSLTFLEFTKTKSKSWFNKVQRKKQKSNEVAINIGIFLWNERAGSVKPIRGKRVCLRINSDASYERIHSQGLQRMTDFHRDVIVENTNYLLAFESGEIAYFIPGTTQEFILEKYKNELGKEYKNITLYLISEDDKIVLDKLKNSAFNDHDFDQDFEIAPKKFKIECQEQQEMDDEIFASQVQALYESDFYELPDVPEFTDIPDLPDIVNLPKILEDLGRNIEEGQFFLNIRRNSDVQRILTLWARQKSQSPKKRLMVRFIGESGIDSGALSKEFLTDVIIKIGENMFPGGAPKDSMLDIQNSNFFSCGQIMAVSIVQGGPPPNFLHKSVYDLLCNDPLDMKELNVDKNFVQADQIMFDQIKQDPEGLSSIIIDHGYSGLINKQHIDEILETVMISIISRRRTYLEEVSKGLELFSLHAKIMQNKALMEPLFVCKENSVVDSNYLLSLLQPVFSSDGSSRKILEEKFLDYLQDFINDLEDSKIVGISSEVLAWYDNENMDETIPYGHKVDADLSTGGLLGWLTGQKHHPLFEKDFMITVLFNHDCFVAYPNHRICFPVVSACSRELTLPTQHCKSYDEFKDNFLLAISKGQAFGLS